MPKNTRNVTFPVEQGMYERLQAFKKAPGLGEAARRALQYLIDHPNEVLDPKPKEPAKPQQRTEPKDEPGKKGLKREIQARFNLYMERAGYPELTAEMRNSFYVTYRVETDPPIPRDILDDVWDLIRAEYPLILERRDKEKFDAELARTKAENERQEAIRAKADQEKRAIEELTRKGLDVIRESKSDLGIGRIGTQLGLDYNEELKLDEILTSLVAEGKLAKRDNMWYYPVPEERYLKYVLDRLPYETSGGGMLSRVYYNRGAEPEEIAKYLGKSDSFVMLALKMLEKENKAHKDGSGRYFING